MKKNKELGLDMINPQYNNNEFFDKVIFSMNKRFLKEERIKKIKKINENNR